MSQSKNEKRDHRNEPTYWFALLEIAREQGDFEKAAEAKRQLESLGVKIQFRRGNRKGATNDK